MHAAPLALVYHIYPRLTRASSLLLRQHMRKRIEEHFEDIKDATEAAEAPQLPPELAEWVVGVCDECCALVRDVPASMRAKLAPTARYLASCSGART